MPQIYSGRWRGGGRFPSSHTYGAVTIRVKIMYNWRKNFAFLHLPYKCDIRLKTTFSTETLLIWRGRRNIIMGLMCYYYNIFNFTILLYKHDHFFTGILMYCICNMYRYLAIVFLSVIHE